MSQKEPSPMTQDVLIDKIKAGDNGAWVELYEQYKDLIHKISWEMLSDLNIQQNRKAQMEQDLFQAGWIGFIKALNNFDKERGTFTTYAYSYIKWAVINEKVFQLNSLGLTERPKNSGQISSVSIEENEDLNEKLFFELEKSLKDEPSVSMELVPEKERFSGRQLALQLLTVLKLFTDEEHPLTKRDLLAKLKFYRNAKYNNSWMEKNSETLSSAIKDLLSEISELSFYEKKKGEISNLYYKHPFKNQELDEIIQLVAFTDMLSGEEKEQIIEKLMGTASLHYRSPFWDGSKLRFNPQAVYGRFSSKVTKERKQLAENIRILQYAVNIFSEIRFKFNRYDENGKLKPVSSDYRYLSPYHLVVYHDNFYCIGLKNDDNRIWHYRVDLMSEIEVMTDDEGNQIPARVCDFPGLPIGNSTWNPEKYMAEHLNMAYDFPKEIHIKIRNSSYTILHDWFSGYYEKTDKLCEEGYQIVKVKTSPTMIVHWALQYGDAVEIMDEDLRAKIREEIEKIKEIYK